MQYRTWSRNSFKRVKAAGVTWTVLASSADRRSSASEEATYAGGGFAKGTVGVGPVDLVETTSLEKLELRRGYAGRGEVVPLSRRGERVAMAIVGFGM